MSPRIPSIDDIAALRRDEWESLCAGICSLVFQAHRVEDRHGRGNGMDGWRETLGGIEGFQYRRLDNRFGDPQVRDLKTNIDLAVNRCRSENGKSLQIYSVLLNIDLEPGHMGSKGEIDRWRDLAHWAHATHSLALTLYDVTWVRTRLLQFPMLRPDLFEDVAGAVAEARAKIEQVGSSNEEILARLESMIGASHADGKLKRVLAGLAREARIHYERGLHNGRDEEYLKALNNLEDARRLLELENVDDSLLGQVLTILCGVKVVVGKLIEALADGERAVAILDRLQQINLARIARGNVGMAMYRLQRYNDARAICEALVLDYEREGNLLELVRIIQHLAELSCNMRDIAGAEIWSERLYKAANALVDVKGGVDELTLSAIGTATNVFIMVAEEQPEEIGHGMLLHAHGMLINLEEMASQVQCLQISLLARLARAKVLWDLDNLVPASVLYADVSKQSEGRGFWKIAADARFNRAMVLNEQGLKADARAEFIEARRRYVDNGDPPSVADVDRMLVTLGLG